MTGRATNIFACAVFAAASGLLLAVAGGAGSFNGSQASSILATAAPIPGLRAGPEAFVPAAGASNKDATVTARASRHQRPRFDLTPVSTRLSDEGFDLIEQAEGLRLKAYYLAGQWLVGYGHARHAYEGLTISRAEAQALLRHDVHDVERQLDPLLAGMSINDNEYAALVSLAYNLGVGAFQKTLVYRRLAAGDRAGAADAFRYLTTANIRGERVELPVLVMRRARERALFLAPPERDLSTDPATEAAADAGPGPART